MANLKQSDLSGGMCDVNVSLAPSNTSSVIMNMDCDVEIGSVVSRLGRATVGAQLVAGVNVLGLVQHVDQADSTKNKLLASVNDAVSATNADVWSVEGTPSKSLEDDTKDLKTYFLNYAGDTLRLNGTDTVKAYNSTTWITTGGVFDLGNIPTGYKYPKEFLDRVYLWGNATTPYRLYYSGVLSSGTVSWVYGQGYVDIEPEDNGGEATGLGKVPGYLLIFKRRSIHRWNFSSAFPESLISIGAYSQESIVEAGGLCAFYSDSNENDKGFYITDGDRPVCISANNNRPIKKWVDAISTTAVVAGYATENIFAWSVGNLTVDGETYNNVVLRYNKTLNQWTMRTYPTAFKRFASYVVSGVHTIVGGDDAGTVYRIDKSATYNDAVTTTTRTIPFKVRTQHQNFGDNREKSVTDNIVIRGKNIEVTRVSIFVDEILEPIAVSGKKFWKKIMGILGVGNTIKGNTIAVEVAGESSGSRVKISEIEIPSIDINQKYV